MKRLTEYNKKQRERERERDSTRMNSTAIRTSNNVVGRRRDALFCWCRSQSHCPSRLVLAEKSGSRIVAYRSHKMEDTFFGSNDVDRWAP